MNFMTMLMKIFIDSDYIKARGIYIMNYEQAEQTAEKLLQMGNFTYEQISYATELPEWHVASMAEEIHHEQDAIIQEIRKTIIGMQIDNVDNSVLRSKIVSVIELTHRITSGRKIGQNERKALLKFFAAYDIGGLIDTAAELRAISRNYDYLMIHKLIRFSFDAYSCIAQNILMQQDASDQQDNDQDCENTSDIVDKKEQNQEKGTGQWDL